jgi:hypothetical protein
MRTVSYCFAIILSVVILAGAARGEEGSLRSYLRPAEITQLDWKLMEFNLHWLQSLTVEPNYMNANIAFAKPGPNGPVIYCGILVQNKRTYNDYEPFLGLNQIKQLEVLKVAVRYFTEKLKYIIPETWADKGLVEIDFQMAVDTDYVTIATYRNGEIEIK